MGHLVGWQMGVNDSEKLRGSVFRADFTAELFYAKISHEEGGIRFLRNIGI
jgi:hypothetical protein